MHSNVESARLLRDREPVGLPLLDLDTEIIPAQLRNKAGVVGAALYAAEGGG